jgi:hypothetical protein
MDMPPHGGTRSWMLAQGALKKKVTGLDVVGWFLGGQKYQGWSDFFPRFFCRVFELPSPRNAQKRDKKIEKKSVLIFLSIFLSIVL